MADTQNKAQKQAKKFRAKALVLSERKPVKYKIIKIQNSENIRKKHIDTASTAVQSQAQTEKKPEKAQEASNVNNNKKRKSNLTKTTTSTNNSDDKNKDTVKTAAQRKVFTEKATVKNSTSKQNYFSQNKGKSASNEIHTAFSNSSKIERQKLKAAEINNKLKSDIEKVRTETKALEKSIKIHEINKAKEKYKVNHLNKANADTERFKRAFDNTIKKETSQNPEPNKHKAEASLHYKKKICYNSQGEKIEQKHKKADQKSNGSNNVLKRITTAASVVSNPKQAPKTLVEEQIRKTKLGNALLDAKDDVNTLEEAAKSDSLADATSNMATSLPEHQFKRAVRSTVNKTITSKGTTKRLADNKKAIERKYGHEAAKAQRAERNARRAKESAIHRAKIRFYKEEKGLIKSASAVKNAKVALKKIAAEAGKAAFIAAKEAIAALIAAAGPVLIVIIIIILVVAVLFAWLQPQTKDLYNEATNQYEPVAMETDQEILKGYIKYIQQYFDKKQLEILKVVDFQFGGFEPDEYDYENSKVTTSHLYQDEVYVISSKKVTVGIGGSSDPVEVTTQIYTQVYYKTYPDGIYKTVPEEAEITNIILDATIPLEELINKWSLGYDGVATQRTEYFQTHYTLDVPTLYSGMDISNLVITEYDGARMIKKASALEWINEYAELYARAYKNMNNGNGAMANTTTKFSDFSVVSKGRTPDHPAEDPTTLSRMDNHIWGLNQISEKYIKLSDYCDMESIIAMAAIKKWGDINADGFDSSTYDFTINEDDLDAVLQQIYSFDYSYRYGKCPDMDCHRETTPGGFAYSCNKTHQILTGKVNNWEYIYDNDHGDISFVKNKLGITGENEEIYNVYKEYISEVLGTSTKLDDYETSAVAQRRLEALYEAENGPRPSMPQNIHHTIYKDYYVNEDGTTDSKQHYFIRLTWDRVDGADSYIVYEYNVLNDKYIRCAGTTTNNEISIDVGTLMTYTTYLEDGVLKSKYESRAVTKNYLVLATNENGNSKYSSADVYTVTVVPDDLTP